MSIHDTTADTIHPLLHPDIFAIISTTLGECFGGPDFCAWVSTCKRAQRLSKRVDVSMIACMLQNAYHWQYTASIMDQIILPHDLICKMIKHNSIHWFALQPIQRTFEICKIACKRTPSIVMQLYAGTYLTICEQCELWLATIARYPCYINYVERSGIGITITALSQVKLSLDVTIDDLEAINPASLFSLGAIEIWKRQIRNRERWRKFCEDAMYCTIGSVIGGVCEYHKGASVKSAIMFSIMTAVSSLILRSL